jgi:hypothetical protein
MVADRRTICMRFGPGPVIAPVETGDAERMTPQARQPFRTDQTVPLQAQAVVAKDLEPSGSPLR